jgi:hypothetical protein
MGYTHYFQQTRPFTPDEWDNITAKVVALFHRCKQVAGPLGEGRPIVNNEKIHFNGVGDEAHKTCLITREHNTEFNFCKTNRKLYDRYVTATLLICHHYAKGALDISSDGSAGGWQEGYHLAILFINGGTGINTIPVSIPSRIRGTELAPKAPEPPKVDTKEIDEVIEALARLAGDDGKNPFVFIVNYLKANIDDIKEAYLSK